MSVDSGEIGRYIHKQMGEREYFDGVFNVYSHVNTKYITD